MLFSSKVAIPALVQWCRALRHGVDIGLAPGKIFRQQAKSGPLKARDLAKTLSERLQNGESLEEALKPDQKRFPLLFVELITIGEKTGRLTETFEVLEEYFETVVTSRKQFFQALIWPILMYISSIFIIAAMLLILGLIAPADGKGFDVLGLGLLGPKGAMVFLTVAGMFTSAVVFTFFYVRENDTIRAKFESTALNIPGLASCFRAFALQRFSLGMQMTSEAGMKADKALHLSFRATANEAYRKHADRAAKSARGGEEITPTLAECGTKLFPEEYIDAVQVGEVTGRLPDVMRRQAIQYRDEAARQLKVLTMIAGGLVYGMVGLMIIVVIIRIVMSIGGVYQDAMKGL